MSGPKEVRSSVPIHEWLEVIVEVDDKVRPGMVTLPHGYQMRYRGGEPQGPQTNRLTASDHCDPLARTPYHMHLAVTVRAVEASTSEREVGSSA